MSTFLEMQDEVLAHGFDANTYRARIKTWINEGLRVTMRRLRVRTAATTSVITTVSGTATSTLPTDFLHARSVKDDVSDLNLAYYEDPAVFDELGDTARGKPTAYTVDGANLRLYPTPGAVYTFTLRYWKSNTALSGDTDTPSTLPSDWHHLLVTYALSRAFRAEDDPEMANFMRGEYDRDIQACMDDLQDQSDDGPVQVPGMWAA